MAAVALGMAAEAIHERPTDDHSAPASAPADFTQERPRRAPGKVGRLAQAWQAQALGTAAEATHERPTDDPSASASAPADLAQQPPRRAPGKIRGLAQAWEAAAKAPKVQAPLAGAPKPKDLSVARAWEAAATAPKVQAPLTGAPKPKDLSVAQAWEAAATAPEVQAPLTGAPKPKDLSVAQAWEAAAKAPKVQAPLTGAPKPKDARGACLAGRRTFSPGTREVGSSSSRQNEELPEVAARDSEPLPQVEVTASEQELTPPCERQSEPLPQVAAMDSEPLPQVEVNVSEQELTPQRKRSLRRTLPRWRLHNLAEQGLLKGGLVCLHEEAMRLREKPISELPRRGDGASLFLRPSFFVRLLEEGGSEFKCLMESDVSASQRDLRYLEYAQLLTIRVGTLDFATESVSHSARTSFLNSVDLHLFEKLTRSCLTASSMSPSPKADVLHALGVRLAFLRGAVRELEQDNKVDAPVPARWLVSLNAEDWSGSAFAVYSHTHFHVEVLPGDRPVFTAHVPPGDRLALVSGSASGRGKDRRVEWDVYSIDPQVDDVYTVLEELSRAVGDGTPGRMVNELLHSAQRSADRRAKSGEFHIEAEKDAQEDMLLDADEVAQGVAILSSERHVEVIDLSPARGKSEDRAPP